MGKGFENVHSKKSNLTEFLGKTERTNDLAISLLCNTQKRNN